MTRRIKIGKLDDFPRDKLMQVKVADITMIVSRIGDHVCAAQDRCPHLGLPFTEGPGACYFDNGVIQCPWHNSRFELCSGKNVDWVTGFMGQPTPKWSQQLLQMGRTPAPLTTYTVIQEDGFVYVEI